MRCLYVRPYLLGSLQNIRGNKFVGDQLKAQRPKAPNCPSKFVEYPTPFKIASNLYDILLKHRNIMYLYTIYSFIFT